MEKQQKILWYTLLALGAMAVLFLVLSNVEPALLMVGFACLTAFFVVLTFVFIKSARDKAKLERNQQIEELMNSEDEDEFDFGTQKRKHLDIDRYTYVFICAIATCVTLYMFIRSIISF